MWRIVPLALLQSVFLAGGQVLLKLALAASGPFKWSWAFFRAQLTNWGTLSVRLYGIFRFLARWVAPLGVAIVFLNELFYGTTK